MSAFIPEEDSEDELPAGWEERANLQGQVYYANHHTKQTQWRHPRTGRKKQVSGALPFGWERDLLADGKTVIYVNHELRKTTFTDPRLAFATEIQEASSISSQKIDAKTTSNNFRQRFDASTTADQILHGADLTGLTAIITGASVGGLGFETARSLSTHGCYVILACRTLEKGETAMGKIRAQCTRARVDCISLDLSSLASVRLFVDKFLKLASSLDLLILNAAVFGKDHSLTVDGLEETFQTNYLSHFYLASLLRPIMTRNRDRLKPIPKIIVVSAESHRFSDCGSAENITPSFLSPTTSKTFTPIYAYNNSKLWSLMFAMEADVRWRDVCCVAVHPGNMIYTNLSRHWWLYRLLFAAVRPFAKSVQQAAGTVVFAAAASELNSTSGLYINNCFLCKPADIVESKEARKALWENSVQFLMDRLRQIEKDPDMKLKSII